MCSAVAPRARGADLLQLLLAVRLQHSAGGLWFCGLWFFGMWFCGSVVLWAVVLAHSSALAALLSLSCCASWHGVGAACVSLFFLFLPSSCTFFFAFFVLPLRAAVH